MNLVVALLLLVSLPCVVFSKLGINVPLMGSTYEFKIGNVISQVRNPDYSMTYKCQRLQGSLVGFLKVKVEDKYYVRVIESDGICTVNNCNMPPMLNMRFNLKTGYSSRCNVPNTNKINLGDGKKTCAWVSSDCESAPACKPTTSAAKITSLPDYEVKATLKCRGVDVGFYCYRTMPNVWFVATNQKHQQLRIVQRVTCTTQLPCLEVKKVSHAHYYYKDRTVTYVCDSGYHQIGIVNKFTCDAFTGDWSSVTMKCSRSSDDIHPSKFTVFDIILTVFGGVVLLGLAAIFIVCKCICGERDDTVTLLS